MMARIDRLLWAVARLGRPVAPKMRTSLLQPRMLDGLGGPSGKMIFIYDFSIVPTFYGCPFGP